jgi:hypothetical protein
MIKDFVLVPIHHKKCEVSYFMWVNSCLFNIFHVIFSLRIDIISLIDSICTLVNVIIINSNQVDLIL